MVSVETFELIKFRQIIFYLEYCKISKTWFKWLNKSNWEELNYIMFGTINTI
jgi:hypothetical protein